MVENFDLMINESVQQYKNLRDIHFSFEHVPREQLSILMETIKLSYYSMKIAVPCTYIYICVCISVRLFVPLYQINYENGR